MADMLKGKSVLVTGAGGGIGREMAILCAREGARVVVNDLGGAVDGEGAGSQTPAQKVCEEIKAFGGVAIPNYGSVAEPAAAEAMIRQAVENFGRIDGVINNAGILRDRIFHRMSHLDWKQVIDVHLNGAFNTSRAAANYFKEQKSGAFVHFTSTSGLVGNFGQANYSAAKMGIVGLSRSIALDMKAFNVRSNCISPFAWTRMIGTIPADTPQQVARLERSKRMTPAKIAPMAVFLLSDAAEGVTSQIFGVRMNEIMLFSANRPVRSVHMSEGWTPQSIAETAIPAMKPHFISLDRSPEYFTWDPV
jgi:NAD(P)-dependent dehydrogenase (short-subunit alcohol dehydrogenase family)